MKIIVPEHIGDITLGQFQKFILLDEDRLTALEFDKHTLNIFCGIPINSSMKAKESKELIEQITKALNLTPPFVNRFNMDGKEFGFIPNLDNISNIELSVLKMKNKEFFDTASIGQGYEEVHRLMAVLFRPITGTDTFGNYKIEEYNGTVLTADSMKDMPLSIVQGALVFFQNLATELRLSSLKFTQEVLAKETKRQASLVNGDGMQP